MTLMSDREAELRAGRQPTVESWAATIAWVLDLLSEARAERDTARAEIAAIDRVLDRRDALSHVDNRIDKLLVLLRTAGANDPKAEIARLLAQLAAARRDGAALRLLLCEDCVDEHVSNTQSVSCYCDCHDSQRDRQQWVASAEAVRAALRGSETP